VAPADAARLPAFGFRPVTTQDRHFETRVERYGKAAIDEAAALIRAGQPVAVPTETVYGLAGRADSGEAVARIYAAKGRPSFNPLIVHVASIAQAETLARFDDRARQLAAAFWPGPLTLILPVRDDAPLASLTTAGLDTVAIRMPSHRAMQALLAATGLPLAAPSANASGSISPTRADHVLRSLQGRIPMILDDGPTSLGLESTIVGISDDAIILLRPGPIGPDEIARVAGPVGTSAPDGRITAPGQLASHYAPAKPLRLNATDAAPSEWLIGFGAVAGNANLSREGDLTEAAARLFDLLHEADAQPLSKIAVAPIPRDGLGMAINDRLGRAAAPRP
jgi:L-threonylcarbamoyladenylate synthase